MTPDPTVQALGALSTLGDLSAFWSTLIGAIVGAVVGGAISALLQWQSGKNERLYASEARTDQEITRAFSVSVKLSRILSGINLIKEHIDDSLQSAPLKAPGVKQRKGEIIRTLGNKLPSIWITPEESSVFLRLGNLEIVNALIEIDMVYNDLIQIMDQYSSLRTSVATQGEVREPGSSLIWLSDAALRRVGPQLKMLDDMAEALLVRVPSDYEQAKKALELVSAEGRKQWGKRFPNVMTEKPTG